MNIRASMLPGYPDCPRRAAAKQFKKDIQAAGYELRQLAPSAGSSAGTSVHKGSEVMLRAKWQGATCSLDDAVAPAIEAFREETGKGCEWDDSTPNANVGEFQIRRMVQEYQRGVLPGIMPLTVLIDGEEAPAVELELVAKLGNGWETTGHSDVVDDQSVVHDTKTGSLERPYYAQLGDYSLLCRSNKIVEKVKGLQIDFIKRSRKTKDQDPVHQKMYPVAASERAAAGMIHRIMEDHGRFMETKDPGVFLFNTMSMMCTEKYCPAFGTSFCELSGK